MTPTESAERKARGFHGTLVLSSPGPGQKPHPPPGHLDHFDKCLVDRCEDVNVSRDLAGTQKPKVRLNGSGELTFCGRCDPRHWPFLYWELTCIHADHVPEQPHLPAPKPQFKIPRSYTTHMVRSCSGENYWRQNPRSSNDFTAPTRTEQ